MVTYRRGSESQKKEGNPEWLRPDGMKKFTSQGATQRKEGVEMTSLEKEGKADEFHDHCAKTRPFQSQKDLYGMKLTDETIKEKKDKARLSQQLG